MTWKELLKDEFEKPYFKNLQNFLKNEYNEKIIYPPKNKISEALNLTQPDDVKVVILGQDPYHGRNQANGMSFSVNKNTAIPPSLSNIYTEIKREYPDIEIHSHGDLSSWAKQGVLLLNAILTVQANKPASHRNKGWETYTDEIIRKINEFDRPVVFMLWGNFAKEKINLLNNPKHLILTASHPSPYSASYGFIGCNHFKNANNFLIKNGIKPIDWSIK